MRMLVRKGRDLWCLVTNRCRTPFWGLEELKRGDETFASHMDWMVAREAASMADRQRRGRALEPTGNVLRDTYLGVRKAERHE